MTYNVVLSQEAEKDLESLDKHAINRIVIKLDSIREQPQNYVKRLVGVPLYSLLVGDYRVIMDIKNKEIIIFVIKIGHRSRVYNDV
ncbi:MAG: type II toxin-antitoxin system RelE/ParE family toxin [Candidatus Micrarchaeota archaeon]|nr:type II toxin-antitoxin system RelE/ParE family toxin [Candidatus Micrarchaeota archaeon]